MTGLAVALVLISVIAHASWNLMVRRSDKPELTNWLMAICGALLASPIAVFVFVTNSQPAVGWWYILGTVILHIAYFFTLGRAYKHGDLSLVYPIARGLGLVLIPVVGVTVLGESVSLLAGFGIVAIFAGVVMVGSSSGTGFRAWLKPRSVFADRGVLFALTTGMLIAAYSSLDKRGVEYVEPIFYMFCLTLGGSVGILPIIARSYAREEFIVEIRTRWKIGLLGGMCQFLAYTLVLSAFRLSPVSYIGPFRELAILVGVVMAVVVLKERVTLGRATGAIAIGLGSLMVAIAP
tara:strand:+ start:448 stop:1326 length:879 start_codon:yes stop_codon:yes gene_type:complete